MKWRLFNKFNRPAYIFSSPWLLAAAGGLLIMIVVTFAFHNLRLEKRLMTNAMLQKASTLTRVLHSGARASFINDLHKDYWNNESWSVHVQRVIDHLAEDPDLVFFMVVDKNGLIVAHNNHTRIGEKVVVPELQEAEEVEDGPPQIMFSIQENKEFGRVFETILPFTLVFPSILPLPARPFTEGPQPFFLHAPSSGNHPLFRLIPDNAQKGNPHFVVIGLEMKEFDRTLRRLRMQIFMLSLAMLFVGLGGWFSLSAVQGFRVSQKTLDDIQAFTSLLIAKLPVGVIATDVRGYVTTWNQAISRLIGIERSGATGRRPEDILPMQLAQFFAIDDSRQEEMREGRQVNVRLSFGERRCELLCHFLTIVDSQQQYLGRVLLISDVTEIRSLEQRMRESERLAAVGRMAGGVAHEVRNPLSSIKGLALLLKNKFPEGSREQGTAELLIQETERMNRTITEMLSFTRPSVLNLERIDFSRLLEKSMALVRAEATENQIETILEVQPELKPVLGDADRLQQVLMNVFINALQAMEKGGRLVVTLKNREESGEVELTICDTGPGIDPGLISQVFYPYFTTKPAGTGLGLAISQKIIADHGGSIELESEFGKGTTVIIQLPIWELDKTA
ncbi:MAG: ATP-binding protein [Desulfobulbus sp.]|nr:ATP-binding protein [Desulfobulbus sp.]